MSAKSQFDPSEVQIQDFRFTKSNVDAPVDFDSSRVIGFHYKNTLDIGFNLDEKLARAIFITEISTDSEHRNALEANGHFEMMFIYKIGNLEELASVSSEKIITTHPDLLNALASVTYSTARGVLMIKLLGTPFQGSALPVINPASLLQL